MIKDTGEGLIVTDTFEEWCACAIGMAAQKGVKVHIEKDDAARWLQDCSFARVYGDNGPYIIGSFINKNDGRLYYLPKSEVS